MANKYSDALLSAIDILASQRVKEASYDKTVVAEVIKRIGGNKYFLKYENAFIEAFYDGDIAEHSMVYVLIPSGRMTEEKQIIRVVNFYAQTEEEKILDFGEMSGIIVKNNSIIGYTKKDGTKNYFKEEAQ